MSHNPQLQQLCGLYDRGEIGHQEFLNRCTQHVTQQIGCSRAGFWMFIETDNGRVLRCLSMFDAASGRWVGVPEESGPQVEAYFGALADIGHVLAVDARSHPATAGFFDLHLRDTGVRSLLAASVAVNGTLFGAFTCTQVHAPMDWSDRQLILLKEIGARTSLALGSSRDATTLSTLPGAL